MLIPSVDLQGGKAVQLRRGKDLVLTSERDPRELAIEFSRVGEIAVIDLDAARGQGDNLALVEELCGLAPCRVGGGIRDVESARRLLRAGARQLIVGTMADPVFLSELPPGRVMAALDSEGGQVVDQGWTNTTGETPVARAQRLAPHVSGFLYTQVDREGSELGIDMAKVKALVEATDRPVTAAGGINRVTEVVALDQLGVDAQVGMALYKGTFTPAECLVAVMDFASNKGMIPTIVQDVRDGRVLMFSRSTPETLKEAIEQGETILHSRKRGRWKKGEESGNTQRLVRVEVDCDRDTLLFTVDPAGPACHKGSASCFGGRPFSLRRLEEIITQRAKTAPEGSYTKSLLADPITRKAKLIEEATELADAPTPENARWEAADLMYHALVEIAARGIKLRDVIAELEARQR